MINIGKDIMIHEESRKLIKETFELYEERGELESFKIINSKTIIHLYATVETMDEKGYLNGFVDSLFFKARVFDCDKRVVYTAEYRDEIFIHLPCQTRIFKDGSTMLIFDGPTKITNAQCMTIEAPKGEKL